METILRNKVKAVKTILEFWKGHPARKDLRQGGLT
jgi:hypothetical protein